MLSNSQFIHDAKLKMAIETAQYNVPVTLRNIETQDHKQSRPQKPNRKIPHNSDCSDSDDGKVDQARAKPLDIQDLQPSTCSVNESL